MKSKTISAFLVSAVVIVGLVFVAGIFSTLKLFAASSSTPANNSLVIGKANLTKQSLQPWGPSTNKSSLFSTQTIHIPNALSVKNGQYFLPENVRVSPNSNVTWINNDNVEHSAVAQSAIFDTGNIKPGGSATVSIRQVGVIPYFCDLHPWMTGEIIALSPGTQSQNAVASSTSGGYQLQPPAQPQGSHGSTTGG
jgi:plastocyanin